MDHDSVLVWEPRPHPIHGNLIGIGHVRLRKDVLEWASENTPTMKETPSEVTNIMVRLEFVTDRDATLFKLFWM
jgi:hypothetical protein